MKDFSYWKKLHESEQLEEFSSNNIGFLWLKIKSIIRKELIAEFIHINNITLHETALGKQFVELFELLCKDPKHSHKILDEYIRAKNELQLKSLDTKQLVEHIFKSCPEVVPTVGQIKSVDFFINDIPFDLKVTYLPAEYIKFKRKEKGLSVELTFLKSKAKEAKIDFDKKAKDTDIYYEIIEKMENRGDHFCNSILSRLKNEKLEILAEVQDNPKILAKWLYENQGEMRFGSENRLFLVLVDTNDFNSSWKLKRNLDLLKPTIIKYLHNFSHKKIEDLRVTFNYKGKSQKFTALSDIIFVVR